MNKINYKNRQKGPALSKPKGLALSKPKGFTLIEMLVVVMIIALLATIVIVNVNNSRIKARDNRRIADIKALKTAIELYNNDKKEYPQPTPVVYGIASKVLKPLLSSYLDPLPNDPLSSRLTTFENYQYISQSVYNYGLEATFEERTFTKASGSVVNYCKLGTDMDSSWWTSAPTCDF